MDEAEFQGVLPDIPEGAADKAIHGWIMLGELSVPSYTRSHRKEA